MSSCGFICICNFGSLFVAELLVASKKVSIRSLCNEDLLEVVLISCISLGSTIKQLLGLVVAMPSNQEHFQLEGISHCKTLYTCILL